MAQINVWNGTSWVKPKAIHYWDGTAWQKKKGAFWNGTSWVVFISYIDLALLTSAGVYRLNLDDGTLSSSYAKAVTAGFRNMVVDKDGYAYVGFSDGTLAKIDPSGTVIWSVALFTNSIYAVACNEQGYVWAGGADAVIKKLNASDGSQVWSVATPNGAACAEIDVNDSGYGVAIIGAKVQVFSPTGSFVGDSNNYSGTTAVVIVRGTTDPDRITTHSINGSGYLYRRTAAGTAVWGFSVTDYPFKGLCLNADTIFVTSDGNAIYRVRQYTHAGAFIKDYASSTATTNVYSVAVDKSKNAYLGDGGNGSFTSSAWKYDDAGNQIWRYNPGTTGSKLVRIGFGQYQAFPTTWA
jgi:hypothetical protein